MAAWRPSLAPLLHEKQRRQSAARNLRLWNREGGSRADCKPGSFFANSSRRVRILGDTQRHIAARSSWVLNGY